MQPSRPYREAPQRGLKPLPAEEDSCTPSLITRSRSIPGTLARASATASRSAIVGWQRPLAPGCSRSATPTRHWRAARPPICSSPRDQSRYGRPGRCACSARRGGLVSTERCSGPSRGVCGVASSSCVARSFRLSGLVGARVAPRPPGAPPSGPGHPTRHQHAASGVRRSPAGVHERLTVGGRQRGVSKRHDRERDREARLTKVP
jgi:hypothetical protein